jgi:hypothetical protein
VTGYGWSGRGMTLVASVRIVMDVSDSRVTRWEYDPQV